MSASARLRGVLVCDAVVSGATGLLMAVAAGPLHELLEVPRQLLSVAGLVLVPYALGLVLLSRRNILPPAAIVAVIATNVGLRKATAAVA